MNQHLLSSIRHAASVTAIAVFLTSAAVAAHQTTESSPPQRSPAVDEQQAAAMMAERQKMMADMRVMDQKLKDLVARIDAARSEAEKIDAIAAVVKAMVAQRTQIHSQMEAMHARMMDHMMMHVMSMQSGMGLMRGRGQTGGGQPMSNCPMMKALAQEAAHP